MKVLITQASNMERNDIEEIPSDNFIGFLKNLGYSHFIVDFNHLSDIDDEEIDVEVMIYDDYVE